MKRIGKVEILVEKERIGTFDKPEDRFFVYRLSKVEEFNYYICSFVSSLGFNKKSEYELDASFEIIDDGFFFIENNNYKIYLYVFEKEVLMIIELLNKKMKGKLIESKNKYFSKPDKNYKAVKNRYLKKS